jgi:2-C-methyl-D-erythritol 4-phosphate cytidylyltransferase
MNSYALIVAGGSGSRMAADVPKQFLLLAGKPILMRTIEVFHQFNSNIKIILVLPKPHQEYWAKLCIEHSFDIKHSIVGGGETRFQSVLNGLNTINDISHCIVAIHDGVRPLVSKQTLENCFNAAIATGNAVPYVELIDSIREVENNKSKHVNRENYKAIQTPQVFNFGLLRRAYTMRYNPSFTDDASVLEAAGLLINLVEGNRENIKITTPTDLIIAEALIKNQRPE